MKTHHAPSPAEELLSALVDGELDAADCSQALHLQRGPAELDQQWHTYHLIGDVLRANSFQLPATGRGDDSLFVTRFNQRLSERLAVESIAPADKTSAANDGNGRWKMLAGVACMGMVAALAWSVSGLGADSARQMAQTLSGAAPSQVVVASPQGPMVRDVRLEELLAAHKQMAGTSLPVPSGFLRNANFESQAGARR